MKALAPIPIDRARARTDVVYFAQEYLETRINSWDAKQITNILLSSKQTTIVGATRYVLIAIAWAKFRGLKVNVVKRGFIDGEVRNGI